MTRAVFILGLAAVLAVPAPIMAQRVPEEAVVWPLPPEPARIQFAGTLQSDQDLGAEESFFGRLRSSITGDQANLTAVNRPHDVHVFNGRMYVTNGMTSGLIVFDLDKKDADFIQPTGPGQLGKPMGLTGDAEGNVYVADPRMRRVVVLTPDGEFVEAFGGEHILMNPVDVALSPSGDRLYVVDSYLHQVVMFDRSGAVVGRIGINAGDIEAKREALGDARNRGDHELLAADQEEQDPTMHPTVTEPSDLTENRGAGPGEFRYPAFIATAPDGTVWVSDQMNFRVQGFDRDGAYLREFGGLGDGPGRFARPKGIGVDSEGHVYVVDAAFNNVQIFDADGSLLLVFGELGSGPGQLWMPTGMAIDTDDQVVIADRYNNRLQIYKYLGDGGEGSAGPEDPGTRQ